MIPGMNENELHQNYCENTTEDKRGVVSLLHARRKRPNRFEVSASCCWGVGV